MPHVKRPHRSRQHELARGVGKYSRSVIYRKSGRWAKKKAAVKPGVAKPAVGAKQTITKKFGTGSRTIQKPRDTRFYPTEDQPHPLKSNKQNHRPTRLRASIQPGTVLVLLSGRFRGKRVVFVKQLPSGLLLVTGPYKINGVPLRRVNQAYVIATSAKVDISGAKLDDKFTDNYFKKPEAQKKKKTEAEFFAAEPEKKKLDPARSADQKVFDAAILAAVKKQANMAEYLKAHFSLARGQYPHLMKF